MKFNIKNIFLEKANNIENTLMSFLGSENKKISFYELILKSLANCKNKTLSDIARFIAQSMNSVHNLLKILIDMNIINKEVSFEEQTIIKK